MTVRRDATEPLLEAIWPLLNVAAFTAVATSGLFRSQAPQATAPPYGILQSAAAYEALPVMQGGQVAIGQEIRFQIRGVSAGLDDAEAVLIAQQAIQLLDGVVPNVANHLVLRLWWEWTQTYKDPELVNGVPVWNAVSQFCALVDQVS